jgi:hypothetical protein
MENNQPQILLSLNTQTLGISTPVETTSVALEIRVPTGSERIYTNILERLYEKAEKQEIIVPSKIGNFFPYYMKTKLAETFSILMRQQNAEMFNTAVIPIFGYTPSARQQRIKLDGEDTTVELAVTTTPDIICIEATPSSQSLHKYLVIVKKENRTSVQKTIQGIFNKITEPLENQPAHFPIPRCGGRETSESPVTRQETTMTAYMSKLETLAQAQNPQDAGPTEPPKRFRKITISYAGAVTAGILKQSNFDKIKPKTPNSVSQESDSNQLDITDNNATHRQVTWDGSTTDTSRSAGSSLSRSVTNSKIINFKKDIDDEIKELKENLESRMNRQDQRIKDLIDVIHDMNKGLERRIASAVITTLVKEKEKVQELTHGRNYNASEAPLADENGRLPFGPIAQSGGPLDRLHHVEVTVQHMVSVLDSIADHLQVDPTARHLFVDDDEKSEASTIIENQQEQPTRTEQQEEQEPTDNDVKMQMIREYGGIKRLHGTYRSPDRQSQNRETNTESSPKSTPPSKRERTVNSTTSANPEGIARERGES